MSKPQTNPNFLNVIKSMQADISALQKTVNAPKYPNVNTTGLTSAQIDALVFQGTQQPYDTVQIVDTANKRFLVREAGKWCYTTLTTIS